MEPCTARLATLPVSVLHLNVCRKCWIPRWKYYTVRQKYRFLDSGLKTSHLLITYLKHCGFIFIEASKPYHLSPKPVTWLCAHKEGFRRPRTVVNARACSFSLSSYTLPRALSARKATENTKCIHIPSCGQSRILNQKWSFSSKFSRPTEQ